MARIGLAWDLGAGRGHAVRLAALARYARQLGHEPVLFARNLRTMRGAFDRDVPSLLPAPHNDWVPREAVPASWADVLWSECGLHDEAQAVAIVMAWRDAFVAAGVDALLLDAAPLAVPAARALGLRCVAVGTGFLVPPAGPPWPVFRTWEPHDAVRLARREDVLRERIAGLQSELGLSADGVLDSGDAQALFTWPAFDHYPQRDTRQAIHLGPMLGHAAPPRWPEPERNAAPRPRRAPRVFVYLAEHHPQLAALRESLRDLEASVCRGDPPVDVARVLAEADLVVAPGGNLAVAAAARGVPSLLLPTHAETFITAMRLASLGVAVACTEPSRMREALRAAMQPGVAQAARALAAGLDVPNDDVIAQRVLDLLALAPDGHARPLR